VSGSALGARRRRRRIRVLILSGAVVIAVGGAASAAIGFGGTDRAKVNRSALPPNTATVTRTTLTATADVTGTLSYGSATTVAAQAKGKVTWLPPPGSVLQRGTTAYKVDDGPVVLLYGDLPMYRNLASGVDGNDVKQFEQNLSALGYTGFTVDGRYDSATAKAVKAWQKSLGLSQTGAVTPDAVVYASGAVRIAEHKATLGAPASGPIVTYTGTTRQVSIALDIAKRSLAAAGADVKVTLPDHSTVAGKVATVGTVATTVPASGNTPSSTTIAVTVAIADQSKLGALDESPVEVTFTAQQRANVLTVPVSALLALAEGGYGVEVVEGGSSRVVPVETGTFANGRVEISGSGITAGTVVGVPK
jgi:peptidoglycan hydrolase-like protein with peptidoglycan-binding domain